MKRGGKIRGIKLYGVYEGEDGDRDVEKEEVEKERGLRWWLSGEIRSYVKRWIEF